MKRARKKSVLAAVSTVTQAIATRDLPKASPDSRAPEIRGVFQFPVKKSNTVKNPTPLGSIHFPLLWAYACKNKLIEQKYGLCVTASSKIRLMSWFIQPHITYGNLWQR